MPAMPLTPLLLASLAAAAPLPAPFMATGTAQPPAARATVQVAARIISGARVRLGRSADVDGFLLSKTTIKGEDGSLRPAHLVEFQ